MTTKPPSFRYLATGRLFLLTLLSLLVVSQAHNHHHHHDHDHHHHDHHHHHNHDRRRRAIEQQPLVSLHLDSATLQAAREGGGTTNTDATDPPVVAPVATPPVVAPVAMNPTDPPVVEPVAMNPTDPPFPSPTDPPVSDPTDPPVAYDTNNYYDDNMDSIQYDDTLDVSRGDGHRCDADDLMPSPEEQDHSEDMFREWLAQKGVSMNDLMTLSTQSVTADLTTPIDNVPVHWHSICRSDGTDCVSSQEITASVNALNVAFAPWAISFRLQSTTVSNNDAWHTAGAGTDVESEMTAALTVRGCNNLNIYSNRPRGSGGSQVLGYARFPQGCTDTSTNNAAFIRYTTVPGGSNVAYNEGDTLVHEVGHWFGLFHPFSGGCSEPNDFVADTPQQEADSMCETGRDSCPNDPGRDNIDNYMQYGFDRCLSAFTNGQALRMHMMYDTFRARPNAPTGPPPTAPPPTPTAPPPTAPPPTPTAPPPTAPPPTPTAPPPTAPPPTPTAPPPTAPPPTPTAPPPTAPPPTAPPPTPTAPPPTTMQPTTASPTSVQPTPAPTTTEPTASPSMAPVSFTLRVSETLNDGMTSEVYAYRQYDDANPGNTLVLFQFTESVIPAGTLLSCALTCSQARYNTKMLAIKEGSIPTHLYDDSGNTIGQCPLIYTHTMSSDAMFYVFAASFDNSGLNNAEVTCSLTEK